MMKSWKNFKLEISIFVIVLIISSKASQTSPNSPFFDGEWDSEGCEMGFGGGFEEFDGDDIKLCSNASGVKLNNSVLCFLKKLVYLVNYLTLF